MKNSQISRIDNKQLLLTPSGIVVLIETEPLVFESRNLSWPPGIFVTLQNCLSLELLQIASIYKFKTQIFITSIMGPIIYFIEDRSPSRYKQQRFCI